MFSSNEGRRNPPAQGVGATAAPIDGKPLVDALWQRFSVDFDYPVVFTRNAFSPSNPALADMLSRKENGRRHRVAAVIDEGVAQALPHLAERIADYAAAHPERMELAAAPLVLPGGEPCKNYPALVPRLQHWLREQRIDRQSFLLAVGGGALLDLAGFAAAAAHRGVRLLRLPSTVLAQSHSAMGVKNGVNAFGVKNFLGSFAPPFGVIADFDFLDTLEPRDARAGLAEAVKAAAIRDSDFWSWLEDNAAALAEFDPAATETLIRRCAALNLEHVGRGGDPFEFGSASPLDFGQWAAHKLESLTHHALRHGEAIAIGMALDARYSAETGLLPASGADRLCALLERLGFRLWDAALERHDKHGRALVMDGLDEFRQHLGGELSLTLLSDLGRGVNGCRVGMAAMERSLEWLRTRAMR
ncbi:3-dehydroquinate synthase [Methylogaea oryzae]|uniref:3-dehydroquinate synthase n=2 Tax=Methylogaea oryzae TaxID=1295382 RepID=A0A8D5AN36_9GAMM|nr:3-dehydroquinate synthase [Methylogaea oryzae]BBL71700.1 3-dehydroquinate synthase [Methylogaea oryzae]